ncbi:Methyltransferase-like protein, partial [Stegodyphus mimosarum]
MGESAASENHKKPQFGNRYLKDPEKVFQHNAWDDVEWDEELTKIAEEKIKLNSSLIVSPEEQEMYETEAGLFWDKFYGIHQNRFFKDRHWLFTEFPELCIKPNSHELKTESQNVCGENTISKESNAGFPANLQLQQRTTIWEVGCGVGNTVFPILETNIMQQVVNRLAKFLKPGGQILFRDYGKYDMVELRFKPGQYLTEHFYVRGDGTRVYFFSEDQVHDLFHNAGLVKTQLYSSRRLQVNR